MTIIRVNPASVTQYGSNAGQIFESIHRELVTLTNAVTDVRYFGPNAVSFKTECGRVATEFAAALHHDLSQMADAVRAATSNIASSMGGQPINIAIDNKPVTAPAPQSVDYVDVDTSALEALIPAVTRHFETIRGALREHLQRLQQTDWEGNAKESATSAVSTFTNSATAKCDEAEKSINTYINDQLTAVQGADHA